MSATGISIVPMEVAHLAEARTLSLAVEWPHRLEDWAFMLSLGRGAVALDGDRMIGTIMWWPCGGNRATLGMIIVTPERQGQGLGRRLMEGALAEIGPRRILLNATKDGMPLYGKMGFEEIDLVQQHQGVPTLLSESTVNADIPMRLAQPGDLDDIVELDAREAGALRKAILAALMQVGSGLLVQRDGRLLGYAICREFGRGHVIGPVVAADDVIARALIHAWIEKLGNSFIRADVRASSGLHDWLISRGLQKVDDVITMARGGSHDQEPQSPRLFALASQALG